MEQIIHVAKVAGVHQFVSQLPEGYDTMVGERGSTLSGGQKQRVAIARALITDPKILIFDEATSSLDYESERLIQNNLSAIKAGRTMLVIAHRLSAVRACDLILALDRGKIMELGTHEELMAKKGYYHYLYSQQEVNGVA
jgi:ATP-binding cassette, subfamily B, bacterial HlyB/CyaB